MPTRLPHKVRRRPGFFHPVRTRSRRDGWSAQRQCLFLAQLYLTGSVTAAARVAGMTRESAHRLRRREGAESFAAAWDRVLAPPGSGRCTGPRTDYRKVTIKTLSARAETGRVKPVLFRGQTVGIAVKPDNTTLLRLLRRLEALRQGNRRGRTGRSPSF